MPEKKTFYITTPIYYPSDNLHIGHAYTTVAADTIARYKKLMGFETYFLTGTDEHGQKIERKAQAKGVTPQQYVDEIVANIKALWKLLGIEYDDFIRTSDARHAACVQKIFERLFAQGDIYKGEYEGWYCTPCESFFTDLQLVDGKCPDCGRAVERTREESYFFKLSKYQDWLIDYIETHPDFIQPASRKNEMLNNFLKPGLSDLCVSRTSIAWGIPVSFDPKHTVYVWLDALTNYISALGYESADDSLYQKFWPADIHLVGKEIIRFHTIIWPIILHALGLPLPKQVFGHGWLVLDGAKISKSLGNVIDPVVLCDKYGADAIRYYLMREMPFGSDGQFLYESMLTRINADLANDLGNLLSRTVAMIEKYYGGEVPAMGEITPLEESLIALALETPAAVARKLDALQFSDALSEIWKLIGACNRYIDQTAPWILCKTDEGRERLRTVMYTLAECIRFVGVLIGPVMPATPARLFGQLGLTDAALRTWDSLSAFGALPVGTRVCKGEALFPRIDIKAEMAQMAPVGGAKAEAGEAAGDSAAAKGGSAAAAKGDSSKGDSAASAKGDSAAAKGDSSKGDSAASTAAKGDSSKSAPAASDKSASADDGLISIDDFAKVVLRVARVTACERVEKSDKLLKLALSLGGDETRTVVSGIAKHYAPEDMIGRQVVLVANLKPAKLRGIRSEGMILCASDARDETLRLVSVLPGMEDGAVIR